LNPAQTLYYRIEDDLAGSEAALGPALQTKRSGPTRRAGDDGGALAGGA
jgi:hypothetical protein